MKKTEIKVKACINESGKVQIKLSDIKIALDRLNNIKRIK